MEEEESKDEDYEPKEKEESESESSVAEEIESKLQETKRLIALEEEEDESLGVGEEENIDNIDNIDSINNMGNIENIDNRDNINNMKNIQLFEENGEEGIIDNEDLNIGSLEDEENLNQNIGMGEFNLADFDDTNEYTNTNSNHSSLSLNLNSSQPNQPNTQVNFSKPLKRLIKSKDIQLRDPILHGMNALYKVIQGDKQTENENERRDLRDFHKDKNLRRLFETEAELGSDDEEKGDIRKDINVCPNIYIYIYIYIYRGMKMMKKKRI